jgi:hypothetical protein
LASATACTCCAVEAAADAIDMLAEALAAIGPEAARLLAAVPAPPPP